MDSRRSRSRSNSRSNHVWSTTQQPQNYPHRPINSYYKSVLQSGNSVQFSCGQNCCIFDPVVNDLTLRIHDYIFCQLQSHGPYYLHRICKIWSESYSATAGYESAASSAASAHRAGSTAIAFRRKYDIATRRGDFLGSCYSDTIYGRRAEVLQGTFR